MSGIRIAAMALCAGLACCACSAPVRVYRCALPEYRAPRDPGDVWQCNRDVLRRVARNKPFTLAEYREASGFMERLTGIPAGSIDGNIGPLPPRDLKYRLREWDAWFMVNRERLRWDEEQRRIVVTDNEGLP